jgi:hypothetical protein
MVVNPLGYQPVMCAGHNFGGYTALAREIVSGGQLLMGSGTSAVASSGADSIADSDIEVCTGGSALNFAGICMATAASGAPVGVATRGAFIITCAGTVVEGRPVQANGDDAVIPLAVGSVAATMYPIGRALTGAGSEGYAVIDIGRC